MMFTGIHHAAVVVKELEPALRFFHELLGLPVGMRATVAGQGVEAVLLPAGATEIELLRPIDPAGGIARFLARRGEGLHHLCVGTASVAAALAQAQGAGLPLIDQTPRPGLAGTIAFLHPKASHGILVELAQPSSPSGHGSPGTPPAPAQGEPGTNVPKAPRIEMVYAAATNPAGAAETFARNFSGVLGASKPDAGLEAHVLPVGIGSSRLGVLAPVGPTSPVARWLAERGEGLFGLRLGLANLEAAQRRLQSAGIPVEAAATASATWRLRIEPNHAHGLHLLLC
jgi:methylmalonyl-CoA/ethylmalonyl-CoA epimerase